MLGYLNDPVSTSLTVDVEGWLHTGDIGYIDDEDEIFIVDRVKEIIKFKGFQVHAPHFYSYFITKILIFILCFNLFHSYLIVIYWTWKSPEEFNDFFFFLNKKCLWSSILSVISIWISKTYNIPNFEYLILITCSLILWYLMSSFN